jgi:phosphoserine phosphatase
MTKIYITRHGETEWNKEKRMQGWLDSSLTALGRKQAQWLGERLKNVEFHAIYSSSLGRAYETANIVRMERNLQILKNDAFKEINMGSWEGKSQEEIKAVDEEQLDNFWHAPHLYVPSSGENFQEIIDRTRKGIEDVISRHEGENILIVTHGVALKAIMLHFENRTLDRFWEPPFMHQTSLSLIEIDGNNHKVLLHADTSHYKE